MPIPPPGPGAVTRCRPGPAALRGQRHKPCATAELRHLDSNQDQQVQGLPGCQLPHTASLPAVFSPAGVTALFLPREGPDTDSQDGRVIRSWAGRDSNPRCTAFGAAGSPAGLPARAVLRQGIGPRTRGLRAHRSATELTEHEPASAVTLSGDLASPAPGRHPVAPNPDYESGRYLFDRADDGSRTRNNQLGGLVPDQLGLVRRARSFSLTRRRPNRKSAGAFDSAARLARDPARRLTGLCRCAPATRRRFQSLRRASSHRGAGCTRHTDLPGFSRALLPTELQHQVRGRRPDADPSALPVPGVPPLSRDARTRTSSSCFQSRHADPYTTSRCYSSG